MGQVGHVTYPFVQLVLKQADYMSDFIKVVETHLPRVVMFAVLLIILVVSRATPVVQVATLPVRHEDDETLTLIMRGILQQMKGLLKCLTVE